MRTAYTALTLLMIASCGDDAADDGARCRDVRGGGELIQKCGHAPPGYDAGTYHPGSAAAHHDAGADDDDAGVDSRD